MPRGNNVFKKRKFTGNIHTRNKSASSSASNVNNLKTPERQRSSKRNSAIVKM